MYAPIWQEEEEGGWGEMLCDKVLCCLGFLDNITQQNVTKFVDNILLDLTMTFNLWVTSSWRDIP